VVGYIARDQRKKHRCLRRLSEAKRKDDDERKMIRAMGGNPIDRKEEKEVDEGNATWVVGDLPTRVRDSRKLQPKNRRIQEFTRWESRYPQRV